MKVVELLLSNGANVHDKATDTGYSSLIVASSNGHMKVVKLLSSYCYLMEPMSTIRDLIMVLVL